MELSEKGSLTWRITPDLLGIVDASGFFTQTNPAWFATLGYKPDFIESHYFSEFVHPEDIAKTQVVFEELNAGRSCLAFVNRYRHADGSYRWLSWNAVPVEGRFFCSARDISAQKESEAALQTVAQEAALREQFIAVLGHDLRNPLAAMSSGMNILRRMHDDADTRAMLKAMSGSVMRMAGLIDDVMDFARARLGDGLARQPKHPMTLLPTLEQTVQEIRSANPDCAITQHFDFTDPVICEPARIAQLLSNLLSNAVSHGDPARPIHVAAFDEGGAFCLTVANEGLRIPDTARAMLFSPFARADVRESQNGLGLGLFIAAEIAKGHRGTLTFTSDDDGTVFRVEIPQD